MVQDAVLFDLSELVRIPMSTGIQRVCFEILRHWPGPAPLLAVRITWNGRVRLLPAGLPAVLADLFGADPKRARRARWRLWWMGRWGGRVLPAAELATVRAIFNAELFGAPSRIGFYLDLLRQGWQDRVAFLVHDLLPWLEPHFFPPGGMLEMMPYLRLIREVPNVAFVSPHTQQEFSRRLLRSDRLVGRVVPEGSDGLGEAAPVFDPTRRRFTVVGSIEPRKNVPAILEAFESLWADGVDVELTLAGRMAFLPEEDRARFERLKANQPRFSWLPGLSDEKLREVIRGSRATLFPSLGEGFGLPPLESLSLGVPVVVAASVPSLGLVAPGGQVRLDRPDVQGIRAAVLDMLDDGTARRKCQEISGLKLPRWADLGRACADWLAPATPTEAAVTPPGTVAA